MERKVLNLKFSDALDGTVTLSLDNPKEGMTDDEVNMAMDALIATSVFAGPNGVVTGKVSANIVTTSTLSYNLT